MSTLIKIIIFVFVVYVIFQLATHKKPPPPPPPPKDDPDPKTQEKIAINILTGKATPESVQKDENYDIEHIKQWVDKYKDYAVKYSLDAHKDAAYNERLTYENVVLRDICREFLGDDWEEKVNFHDRMHKRYK